MTDGHAVGAKASVGATAEVPRVSATWMPPAGPLLQYANVTSSTVFGVCPGAA